MTNTLKNAKKALTTSSQDIYTCPASTKAIITNSHLANVDGTNNASATLDWTDSSDSNAATKIINTVDVPADAALSVLPKPIYLEAGDKLRGLASASGDIEATVALIEIA